MSDDDWGDSEVKKAPTVIETCLIVREYIPGTHRFLPFLCFVFSFVSLFLCAEMASLLGVPSGRRVSFCSLKVERAQRRMTI